MSKEFLAVLRINGGEQTQNRLIYKESCPVS